MVLVKEVKVSNKSRFIIELGETNALKSTTIIEDESLLIAEYNTIVSNGEWLFRKTTKLSRQTADGIVELFLTKLANPNPDNIIQELIFTSGDYKIYDRFLDKTNNIDTVLAKEFLSQNPKQLIDLPYCKSWVYRMGIIVCE